MGKRRKLKIALDIDGVCVDFLGQMIRTHNLRNPNKRIVTVDDITCFMPDGDLEDLMTEKEWEESFEWFEEHGGYATLESFDGVRTTIEALLEGGHDIVYVTARPAKFNRETLMSFVLNQLPITKIYYASRGKTRILKKIAPDVFVDDAIKNLQAATKAGVPNVYVMDAPYNRGDESAAYKRINNLIQLRRDIEDGIIN